MTTKPLRNWAETPCSHRDSHIVSDGQSHEGSYSCCPFRKVAGHLERRPGHGFDFECSHLRVMGRGKQRGLRYMRPVNGSDDGVMQFLPKRMLSWLVPDEMTGGLVRSLIAVNKSENFGDGKVFVCPVGEIIFSPEESLSTESLAVEI